MSDKTEIEWTDATWNPVTGCAKVSAGCKHCYALREWPRMAANPKTVYYGREFTDVRCHPERLDQPLRWQKPRMIFVNSMSDLFHESVPNAFLPEVFAIMAMAKQHTFQVLTKRAERMREVLNDHIFYEAVLGEVKQRAKFIEFSDIDWPLPNVWIGVSVEDQASADERIPLLMQTPTAVRWISAEPLLGPVDASRFLEFYSGPGDAFRLDWVVAGGESGPSARPMHPEWVRGLRDQCNDAGVPFMFKQWGEWAPHQARAGGDEGGDIRRGHVRYLQGDGREPDGHFRKGDAAVARIGKKAAGRLLDGVLHDGYPV